jgi:CheY-like chemotaxis protein
MLLNHKRSFTGKYKYGTQFGKREEKAFKREYNCMGLALGTIHNMTSITINRNLEDQAGNGSHNQLRILVVDDNIINLKLLSGLFSVLGYTADTAINGYAACQLASETRYDLVCMDIEMPGMDGLEASRYIVNGSTNQPPYLVAVSGTNPENMEDKLYNAGISEFIAKPISLQRVQKLVTQVTAMHEAPRINSGYR